MCNNYKSASWCFALSRVCVCVPVILGKMEDEQDMDRDSTNCDVSVKNGMHLDGVQDERVEDESSGTIKLECVVIHACHFVHKY